MMAMGWLLLSSSERSVLGDRCASCVLLSCPVFPAFLPQRFGKGPALSSALQLHCKRINCMGWLRLFLKIGMLMSSHHNGLRCCFIIVLQGAWKRERCRDYGLGERQKRCLKLCVNERSASRLSLLSPYGSHIPLVTEWSSMFSHF